MTVCYLLTLASLPQPPRFKDLYIKSIEQLEKDNNVTSHSSGPHAEQWQQDNSTSNSPPPDERHEPFKDSNITSKKISVAKTGGDKVVNASPSTEVSKVSSLFHKSS